MDHSYLIYLLKWWLSMAISNGEHDDLTNKKEWLQQCNIIGVGSPSVWRSVPRKIGGSANHLMMKYGTIIKLNGVFSIGSITGGYCWVVCSYWYRHQQEKIQKLVHIWVVSVSFCYCLIPPTKTSYDIGTWKLARSPHIISFRLHSSNKKSESKTGNQLYYNILKV